jgi:hypothetical protein
VDEESASVPDRTGDDRARQEPLAEAMVRITGPAEERLLHGVANSGDVDLIERLVDVRLRVKDHDLELGRREDDRGYIASKRRLNIVFGWTAYTLLVITFVATLALTVLAGLNDSDWLPLPLAGTIASGLMLFGWTWRWFMRTAEPPGENATDARRERPGG